MKNPTDILRECSAIIGERGASYGNQIEDNFSRISALLELSTGVHLSAYQTAIALACVKLARMQQSPEKRDNYIDCINYLAFAASMIATEGQAKAGLDDLRSGL